MKPDGGGAKMLCRPCSWHMTEHASLHHTCNQWRSCGELDQDCCCAVSFAASFYFLISSTVIPGKSCTCGIHGTAWMEWSAAPDGWVQTFKDSRQRCGRGVAQRVSRPTEAVGCSSSGLMAPAPEGQSRHSSREGPQARGVDGRRPRSCRGF